MKEHTQGLKHAIIIE